MYADIQSEQERQNRFKILVSKALQMEGAMLLFPAEAACLDKTLMNRIRTHNSVEARYGSVLHLLDGTQFAGAFF
ncbi:hypothetical protein EON64_14345 [archaeon]|nr:MAG: hypothetical protein EON64_14345 [archaeon]